jgi:hypothetical protein
MARNKAQEEEEERKRLEQQSEGWMLEALKKQYGDDYGDDLNLSM